jgi:DNA-binding NarL/FixJ family response regulator
MTRYFSLSEEAISEGMALAEVLRAIRAIASGDIYLDPAMTKQVVASAFGRLDQCGASTEKELSGREEEVLRLIAWGHAMKEIAARLDISVRTIEVYKTRAMETTSIKANPCPPESCR